MTGVVGPNEVAARAKLTQLTQEHRDLDAAIEAITVNPAKIFGRFCPDYFARALEIYIDIVITYFSLCCWCENACW